MRSFLDTHIQPCACQRTRIVIRWTHSRGSQPGWKPMLGLKQQTGFMNVSSPGPAMIICCPLGNPELSTSVHLGSSALLIMTSLRYMTTNRARCNWTTFQLRDHRLRSWPPSPLPHPDPPRPTRLSPLRSPGTSKSQMKGYKEGLSS